MYKLFIRPILFLINPEKVHHLIIKVIKYCFQYAIFSKIIERFYLIRDERLKRDLCGLTFDNPVGLAAGFDKNAEFYNEFASFGFGCIEIGTVTLKAQPGNPKPRSFRLKKDQALINRMGFNNNGVEEAKRQLEKSHKIIIGGNIGKNTATPNGKAYKEYKEVFSELYESVDYFVVNVSCPNISDLSKLQDQEMLEQILQELVIYRSRQKNKRPIFLKISPDLNTQQIDETIKVIEKTGIDGVVVSNTTVSREGLITSKAKIDKIGNGGLSGLPIRDRSTQMIQYISDHTEGKLPIIGVGGIMSVQDALDKLDAGATLIQIYTGFIYEGPGLIKRINKAILKRYN